MLRRGARLQETPSIFHKAPVRLLYQLPGWRETANEAFCLAVACDCWVTTSSQRRRASGF
jgi:hypothetical protein